MIPGKTVDFDFGYRDPPCVVIKGRTTECIYLGFGPIHPRDWGFVKSGGAEIYTVEPWEGMQRK